MVDRTGSDTETSANLYAMIDEYLLLDRRGAAKRRESESHFSQAPSWLPRPLSCTSCLMPVMLRATR